ncbi:unnamed protein product [Protopolystoma xenopodis]|uniref:Secretory carrier-associated membrane protein n=1 Tax=Protopolystoma xenopodis TaxID=117903 RepID=A0A448WH49_9PLAT|nr:unnamed protein product [Protopolystoma xenopodis]
MLCDFITTYAISSLFLIEDIRNWPPLPSWCPCHPCVRLDFEADIPAATRWLARYTYYLWLFYILLLFINVFGTLAYFVVGTTGNEGPLFGVAIIIFVLMPPLAFLGWYRPIYKALK